MWWLDDHDRTLFGLQCAPCHEIGGALRVTPGSQGSPDRGARARAEGPTLTARVCQVRMLRSEVEVLSRDPDRGNPTLTRQGRGPELTGRSPVRLVALRGLP
jgi:hypothetical protein